MEIKKKLKQNPFVLAPMHGITDSAFRLLCEKYKASYSISEMLSADAVIRDVKPDYKKGFDVVQLFGNFKSPFKTAIEQLECNYVDINLGCPSIRTLKFEAGVNLMQYPKKIEKLFKEITKADKPITAKIRAGYKKRNALEIAKILEKEDIELLTIHPRLGIDNYKGKADWSLVQELKENLEIPVIGSGDIENFNQIENLKKADGLMIGRAAIGNPQIFEEFYCKWKKVKFKKKNKKELFREYLKLAKNQDFQRIRQHALFFSKGEKNSRKIREKISKAKNLEEIKTLF